MFSITTEPEQNINKRVKSDSERPLFVLVIIILAGLLGILIYALHSSNIGQFVSFAMIGIMVAGASLLSGGLLGFLFGIPYTLQHERSNNSASNNTDIKFVSEDQQVNYRANTNLEQISDWLTKILVGVGLTQITTISERFHQIANTVSAGLGNTDGSRVYAFATILFFLICGFLFSYLWTRLFLPGAFKQADLSALVNRVERASKEVKQVNRKLEELEKQAGLDATALSLVQRQLNPSPDIPAVEPEKLNDTIKAASRAVKVQIFNQAETVRYQNWRNDKQKMALTIPIFKALIESDIERKFHRNHGQLGYALKDKEKPNWADAEAELTKAIELRGDEKGWLMYEFNRALCRIRQDEEFILGGKSKLEVRNRILTDLRTAASESYFKNLILKDPDIKKWMSQNEINPNDLDR
jgi:hypothetical protein